MLLNNKKVTIVDAFKTVLHYYFVLTKSITNINYVPSKESEIPIWILSACVHLWNKECCFDGKTFSQYLQRNPEIKLPKVLVENSLVVVLLLFLWPVLSILIIKKHKGRRLEQWLFSLLRPDLYFAYPKIRFTADAVSQRRSDMFTGIANNYDFWRKKAQEYNLDNYNLDNKEIFQKKAQDSGFPTVPNFSIEEAEKYGGPYIVKDPCLDMGIGIKKVENYNELTDYIKNKNVIIQPIIKNNSTLSDILVEGVPLSTLRLITTKLISGVICHHAEFRIGKANSLVDNICRGGLSIEVNLKTGCIIGNSPFESEDDCYEKNALIKQIEGSKKPFSEVKLPFFYEAIDIVKNAHSVIAPDILSIGWDIALTDEGPLLIEANIFAGSREVLNYNNSYSIGNQSILERLKELSLINIK